MPDENGDVDNEVPVAVGRVKRCGSLVDGLTNGVDCMYMYMIMSSGKASNVSAPRGRNNSCSSAS